MYYILSKASLKKKSFKKQIKIINSFYFLHLNKIYLSYIFVQKNKIKIINFLKMSRLLIISLIFYFFLSFTQAQNCTKQLTPAQRDAILKAHNQFRNTVASGKQKAANGLLPQASNMNQMIWDFELEALAQGWANTNPTDHNPNRQVPSAPNDYIGENMYWSSKGTSSKLTPGNFNATGGVASWFNEVIYYNGNVTNFGSEQTSQVIGHFTQIIWGNTLRVGCGILDCVTSTTSSRMTMYNEAVTFVCDYRLGGNWEEEPIYNAGTPCSQCSGSCSQNYTSLCAPSN